MEPFDKEEFKQRWNQTPEATSLKIQEARKVLDENGRLYVNMNKACNVLEDLTEERSDEDILNSYIAYQEAHKAYNDHFPLRTEAQKLLWSYHLDQQKTALYLFDGQVAQVGIDLPEIYLTVGDIRVRVDIGDELSYTDLSEESDW